MRAQVVTLVLALLAAGCLGATLPAPVDGPGRAFLSSAHELMPTAEQSTRAISTGSFFLAWQEGRDYPTWLAPPQDQGVLIENITLNLFLRTTGPVAKTFRFPDIMAYAAGGDAWMALGTTATDPVLRPDQTYELDFDITPPAGGLWVPAGERLGLKIVPVMHQTDAADIEILVGGATPSALAWTQRAYDEAPGAMSRGEASGEVEGSAYAGPATPASAHHRTPVTLDAHAPMLLAWMNTTEHQGIPDIDLSIIGPSGEQVAFSGTPTPREHLRLAPANLEGAGEYTLVVTSYGSARASFTVEWLAGGARALPDGTGQAPS